MAREADGEVVWAWHPDAGVKFALRKRGRRWQTSPVHRGEHEVSRKTIARGMPGETGVTVVTTLVYFVFYRTRGCGRIERPAFPAPSLRGSRTKTQTSRKKHAARSRSCAPNC